MEQIELEKLTKEKMYLYIVTQMVTLYLWWLGRKMGKYYNRATHRRAFLFQTSSWETLVAMFALQQTALGRFLKVFWWELYDVSTTCPI